MYLRGRIKGKARFVARYIVAKEGSKGECETCGWPTRRSPITHIHHDDCYLCRKLKMVYGSNIKVERRK